MILEQRHCPWVDPDTDITSWILLILKHNTMYPEDQWTHAYTDGSSTEATREEGGGVYIGYNDGKAHITIKSTNFKTEAEALQKAAIEIRDNYRYPEPSPTWSSSQMLSLSSTHFFFLIR